MKKTKKIIGIILSVISLCMCLYLRIANIDMTEMRLFISFWYIWIAAIAVGIGGYILMTKD